MRARSRRLAVAATVVGLSLALATLALVSRHTASERELATVGSHAVQTTEALGAPLVRVDLVEVPRLEEPVDDGAPETQPRENPERRSLRLLVIADLHVLQAPNPERDPDSWLPPELAEFTAAIPALEPELVIIAGDLTSGDHRLHHRDRTVRRWWAAVSEALEPVRAAGIPILPIPGNHDLYQPAHEGGYREWADLDYWMGPLAGTRVRDPENPDDAPLYYAVDYEQVHLVLLAVPGRHLEETQLDWLRRDLATAPADSVRLAFGHLPLRSAIGRPETNDRLLRDLGTPLVEGGVSAYFAGHEHVIWDEMLDLGGHPLRQVIVGVGGGGYRFALNSRHVHEHCHEDACVLPTGEYRFAALRGRMRDQASGVLVEVAADGTLSVQPHVLREGLLVPLEPADDASSQVADRRPD